MRGRQISLFLPGHGFAAESPASLAEICSREAPSYRQSCSNHIKASCCRHETCFFNPVRASCKFEVAHKFIDEYFLVCFRGRKTTGQNSTQNYLMFVTLSNPLFPVVSTSPFLVLVRLDHLATSSLRLRVFVQSASLSTTRGQTPSSRKWCTSRNVFQLVGKDRN